MTKRKLSIYPSPDVDSLLFGREHTETLSGRLGTIAARYRAIVEAEKPDLTEAEWNYCRDVFNGSWLADALSLEGVWMTIDDGLGDGLDRKWGVDGRQLALKVRAMRKAQVVALVEAVESWWAEDGRGQAASNQPGRA